MIHEAWIDPGLSTGIVWGHYDDDTPWTRDGYVQVTGGVTGLLMWLDEMDVAAMGGSEVAKTWLFSVKYAEKYKPLVNAGFSQTLDSTYPLVVEGALITLDLLPEYESKSERWAFASSQYWVSGKTTAEKRKKQKDFLREHDLYLTAGDVGGSAEGHKDAEDVMSATFHALSRMRRLRHTPTLAHYFGESP